MKLFSFEHEGDTHVGALTPGGGADLTAAGFPGAMNEVIEGGADMLRRISAALASGTAPAIDPGAVRYRNVTRPGKIICAGFNYQEHAEETGGERPRYPVLFCKFNDALHPAGEPVRLPPWLQKYDYEAELVVVVGKAGFHIPTEAAQEHIFGYTCGNDLSARDAQFLSSQWLAGKSLPQFGPAGPVIVTRDSFDPREGHRVVCEVNGEERQRASTADMMFSCCELLCAASAYFPLSPGDLIFTGTPSGVILGRPKGTRVWLKAGDTVTVRIDGVGELVSPLA